MMAMQVLGALLLAIGLALYITSAFLFFRIGFSRNILWAIVCLFVSLFGWALLFVKGDKRALVPLTMTILGILFGAFGGDLMFS